MGYSPDSAAEHTKEAARPAITSAIADSRSPTLLQWSPTMCCYGAQIFSPSKRRWCIWPVASTYLRKGALGFVGSTMMAWVRSVGYGACRLDCPELLEKRFGRAVAWERSSLASKHGLPQLLQYGRYHTIGDEREDSD